MAKAILAASADRQKLKEIGKNACQEIYLSWDDAVARACERYRYVIQRYTRERRSSALEQEMRELRAVFEQRRNEYARKYYRFGRQLIEGKLPSLRSKPFKSKSVVIVRQEENKPPKSSGKESKS